MTNILKYLTQSFIIKKMIIILDIFLRIHNILKTTLIFHLLQTIFFAWILK